MELETLENDIGNIGKWNQKDWKMELERLEKCNWKYWKMALGKLENTFGNWHRKLDLLKTGMRNIMELDTLEN